MDIKCIWKVSHYRLKSCDQLYEGSLKYVQKTALPESISTAITVYNQNNAVSVAFVSHNLPVSYIVQHIQSLLNRLCAYGLVVGYCACIVFIPTIIFTLTCWPCLICCTSISHCCCCYCYVHYVRSRTWVWICKWHCIVLLPLLIATTYNPIVLAAVLLVCYITYIFLFSLFSFNIIVIFLIVYIIIIIKYPRNAYIIIKDPIFWEYLVLEMFLYFMFSDSDTI